MQTLPAGLSRTLISQIPSTPAMHGWRATVKLVMCLNAAGQLLSRHRMHAGRHFIRLCMLQKAGLMAAGIFTAAERIDPKDTEQAFDTAAPD